MKKVADNEYIIESSPYTLEKITIIGKNILWYCEDK
jgi:hypothetical protein